MDNNYFSSASSLGHIAGNITYVMQKYYMSYFPKDTFKHVHKATRSMTKEFRHKDINSLNKILKRENPVLAVFPKVMIGNEHMMLGADRLQRPMPYDKVNPFMSRLIQGYDIGKRLDFAMRRLRMQFDMTSIWSSELVSTNKVWELKNSTPENRPIMIKSRIKFPLPKHFMLLFAKDSGFEVVDGIVSDVAKFVEHVNKCSKFVITYELKTSSGVNEFFCVYKTDFIITFGGIDVDEGETAGQTRKNFKISHGVQVDVSVPSIFYYTSRDKMNIDNLTSEPEYTDNMVASEGAEYDWIKNKDPMTGWNIQSKAGYEFTEVDENGKVNESERTDTIKFKELLPPDLVAAYDIAMTKNIDPSTFIRLVYYSDRTEATALEYSVEYTHLEASIKGMPYKSYVIAIYADTNIVHKLIDDSKEY